MQAQCRLHCTRRAEDADISKGAWGRFGCALLWCAACTHRRRERQNAASGKQHAARSRHVHVHIHVHWRSSGAKHVKCAPAASVVAVRGIGVNLIDCPRPGRGSASALRPPANGTAPRDSESRDDAAGRRQRRTTVGHPAAGPAAQHRDRSPSDAAHFLARF